MTNNLTRNVEQHLIVKIRLETLIQSLHSIRDGLEEILVDENADYNHTSKGAQMVKKDDKIRHSIMMLDDACNLFTFMLEEKIWILCNESDLSDPTITGSGYYPCWQRCGDSYIR
jgi:hypothetical protein